MITISDEPQPPRKMFKPERKFWAHVELCGQCKRARDANEFCSRGLDLFNKTEYLEFADGEKNE